MKTYISAKGLKDYKEGVDYSFVEYEIQNNKFKEDFIIKLIDNFKLNEEKANYNTCVKVNDNNVCTIFISSINKTIIVITKAIRVIPFNLLYFFFFIHLFFLLLLICIFLVLFIDFSSYLKYISILSHKSHNHI